MFDLREFSPAVRELFRGPAAFWPSVVEEAIASGMRDLDKLTDLMFFMHHPERMDGSIGRGISQAEDDFEDLVEQWQQFRGMVLSLLDIEESSSDDDSVLEGEKEDDWILSDAARRDLREHGGQALVDWADTSPSKKVETMEFTSPRAKLKSVLAWKSRDPASTCRVNHQMIQLCICLREDSLYWEKRTGSRRQGLILAETYKATNRIYREHILENKLCPEAAMQRELAEGKKLKLQMAGGFVALLQAPTPRVTPKTFLSLEKLIESFAPTVAGAE